MVTRATTVGLEHGGPPTAALGPYHSAFILGGVPYPWAGSLSSAFAYWSQATCDVQGRSRLLSPVFCLHACTGICARSEYFSSYQREKRSRGALSAGRKLRGVEPMPLHGCEHRCGTDTRWFPWTCSKHTTHAEKISLFLNSQSADTTDARTSANARSMTLTLSTPKLFSLTMYILAIRTCTRTRRLPRPSE